MNQHLMGFTPNNPVFCKEYLCSCNSCFWFRFKCLEENAPLYSDIPCDDDFGDFNDDDDEDEVDRTEKFFNFAVVPSFVSLFSCSPNLVKVTEKGTASENYSDPYGHFISAGESFLKGFIYTSKKKYQLLPNEVVFFQMKFSIHMLNF